MDNEGHLNKTSSLSIARRAAGLLTRLHERTNAFDVVFVCSVLLSISRGKITLRSPTGATSYGSLPIIELHSSFVNARSVRVRMLPAEQSA
jgi:hypothetical protein